MRPPVLSQVNLVVADMAATVAFYRRLGWTIHTPTAEHTVAELPNGLRVEFDTPDFARVWDSGYGGSTVCSASPPRHETRLTRSSRTSSPAAAPASV